MHELMPRSLRGEVTLFDVDHPETVFYHKKNVIVNGVSFLFARLMSNPLEPLAGVWGLAVGAGGTGANGWSANTQPDPTSSQIAMVSEIKRKQLFSATNLDVNGNPTTALTTTVNFLTTLNATTDGISVPIREMGLIGGGTTLPANGGPTNMLTAPYFDPANPAANTVILINYLTLPPFILPPNISLGIGWKLSF
jgi:hypothetical protein